MMFVNLSDIAIVNIKGSDYPCIINYSLLLLCIINYSLISKNETINLMQNTDLTKKSGAF